LTGIDGALRIRTTPSQPSDGPLPDVMVALANEYFVEWQVADMTPRRPEK
jgi:hypothetical protein